MIRLRFWLLVAVVAVTAHDATFLIGHGLDGYGAALGATGHDGHWQPMAIGVGSILLAALAVTLIRWASLRRQLAAYGGDRAAHRIGPVVPRGLRLAAGLFGSALAVFVLQESLEALAVGAEPLGLAALAAPGYAAAVPAFATIAIVFALASQLIDARIVSLEQSLAHARDRLPRSPVSPPRRSSRLDHVPRGPRIAPPDLGRAPPASVSV